MENRKAVVIGIGNPLRGDDGIGWAVIEALTEPVEVDTISTHQLLPELLDSICEATAVIFVDATVIGEPGSIQITPLSPAKEGQASSHQTSPGVLLAMGMELYGRMPPAHLITITGQTFAFEEQLSPLIQQKVAEVTEQIYNLLKISV